jgi:hypothetical protein
MRPGDKTKPSAWAEYGDALAAVLNLAARKVGLKISISTTEGSVRSAASAGRATVGRAARYAHRCVVCKKTFIGPSIFRHVLRKHGEKAAQRQKAVEDRHLVSKEGR